MSIAPHRSRTREVYAVRWVQRTRRWWCPQNGLTDPRKLALIRVLARKLARRWTFAHVLCQLRIYGKNGRIQSERTYGRDPRRFPG